MNIASMFLRILAILGAIAAAVMFWMIGDTKDRLEADLNNTRSSLHDTQRQLSSAHEENEALGAEVASLEENLEETRANATRLNNQLTQVRRELEQATQAITAREREAETLRTDAAQIRRQLLEERNRVSQLEESLEAEDAAELRASIQELEHQLLLTEQQLQTMGDPRAAPRDEREERTRRVIRGEVAEIGEAGFILLNIGAENGVRENSSVMIRRGPQYIGRATVAEVQDNISIAQVQTGMGRVRTGDLAITLD